MANILKDLIENKWYKTKEIAQSKVDKAWARGYITDEEYEKLCTLINEKYEDNTEETENN